MRKSDLSKYLYVIYLGEKLIGKVKEETNTSIILEKVRNLEIVPHPSGQQIVVTKPFSPTTGIAPSITIHKQFIIYAEDGEKIHEQLILAENNLKMARAKEDIAKEATKANLVNKLKIVPR